ncbi:hypothetical protein [Pseudomonas aeruginosa]|nr:hypothetical protein [Pseudomonas aeruginosa]NNB82559.1 hypothetical protein [Pseudomonas aeruginosa]RUB27027.1 hypothetical protein IPC1432_25130 [Pseudomonas aeruginosa]HCD6629188.1 hypothetical protein [Pseudomonas aeruginosa]HCD7567401.1 hypothetical protein [Pseudomonas aeruginosa]HCZ9130213.1 hypothetical protein [Pseudomonas aeruginosa]
MNTVPTEKPLMASRGSDLSPRRFHWRSWLMGAAFFMLVGPPVGACLMLAWLAAVSVNSPDTLPADTWVTLAALAGLFSYRAGAMPALLAGMALCALGQWVRGVWAFSVACGLTGIVVGFFYEALLYPSGSVIFWLLFPLSSIVTGLIWRRGRLRAFGPHEEARQASKPSSS